MRTSTGQKNGVKWTLRELDDLDFADDLALPSNNQKQMKKKTSLTETTAATLGLNVNKGKTKIMKINSKNSPVTLQGDVLDEVQSFMHLGSIIGTNGGRE